LDFARSLCQRGCHFLKNQSFSKEQKMSKLFKLIFLALVSAFLIGCGSSGSSDGKKPTDDEKLSLELLKLSFPDFSTTGSTVLETKSFISYEASKSEIDDFTDALIREGFTSSIFNADIYTKDTTYGTAEAYIIYGVYNIDNSIELSISTDEYASHSSAIFQKIFPAIRIEIADIAIHLFYDDDITSGFTGYMTELEKAKFECQENTNDGYWKCKKTADDIDYEWYGEEDYIAYTISIH
jgi:hypothetical protein